MLIRLGYDIEFEVPATVPIVALLNVHASRLNDLREPDELRTEPAIELEEYVDSFGNRCCRLLAPPGKLRLWNSTLIEDSGQPDAQNLTAREVPVEELPPETLRFLIPSRYCEVDLLSNTAVELFGGISPGWQRVQAICDWVHEKVTFGYAFARPTKTALDVYTERLGVCRDFQHLAVSFCRSLNIPARYVTGYLGDIGVPPNPAPMDFSAWFEVFLEDRWWAFDARFNERRIGRVLMAVGRDAADVAITTSFGSARLTKFQVTADEVKEERGAAGNK
ncbi:MAG: transglutaminase family protein [Acidobacteriaceae bacterium]|nr:transglutaminase family protein [Acidobacteriaceae bacterium]MBV9294042.1 transglutaminase family protein [Acidobacteriaceae bacterium]MBV9767487.1 transglutaminase family protein [Acidobacteriaceae bacterium]